MGYGPFNAGGSASGLDAYSKLESEAAFLQRRGNVPDMDADNATDEGIYHYGSAVKNFYVADGENTYGRLLVFNSKTTGVSGESQTWLWQIALATYPKRVWWRSRVNTEDWCAWRRMIDNVDYDSLNDTVTSHDKSLTNLNNSVSSLLIYQAKQYSWTAKAHGATWSRLCLITAQSGIVGSSFIINIAGTRNSVLYNETFAISVDHPGVASIVKLSSAKYSPLKVRCMVNTSGHAYVEVYDDIKDLTSDTEQLVLCRMVALRCGTVTTYTAFTDGTTPEEGYLLGGEMTVDKYDLQSANGIGGVYTKSEVDALIERMKYMDGKLVYTAGVSVTSSKSATITVGSNVDYIMASAPGGINAYSYPSSSNPAVVTGPATGTKVARGCSANVMVFNCSSSSNMTNAFADGYSPVTFDESGTITFGKSTGYSTGFVNVEGYQYV